jgi:hypothetical protein
MILVAVRREAGPQERYERHPKLSYPKGDHQARVHSYQLVFVMVRHEAGPHERWLKTLKGELENKGPSKKLA